MNIQKVMILPIYLGIFLFGVVMAPAIFADGCGPGTVLIDGVCELDEKTESSSMSIEPLYIIIAVVAIGGIIGAVAVAKRGSKTPKPAQQESVTRERIKTSTDTKESSEFCQSCGTSLKPGARFCGKCGTPRS